MTLVPNGEGGQPLVKRTISVASAVYRLWVTTRIRDAMRWQEGWAHPGQQGFRPKHGTLNGYWEMALRVEDALLSYTELAWILLVYAKCFDRPSVCEPVLQVLRETSTEESRKDHQEEPPPGR